MGGIFLSTHCAVRATILNVPCNSATKQEEYLRNILALSSDSGEPPRPTCASPCPAERGARNAPPAPPLPSHPTTPSPPCLERLACLLRRHRGAPWAPVQIPFPSRAWPLVLGGPVPLPASSRLWEHMPGPWLDGTPRSLDGTRLPHGNACVSSRSGTDAHPFRV